MKTKKNCFIISLMVITIASITNAQSQQKAFFGIGAGLDYGGLGIRMEYQPIEKLGIFGGVGYNLADPGINGGLSYKILTGKRVKPIITAMYGYNGVIKIKYAFGGVDGKSYYGPSIGAGCEIYNVKGNNKLLLEILVPFRNSEFHDRYDSLKEAGYKFESGILPVTFTIGYNFSASARNKTK